MTATAKNYFGSPVLDMDVVVAQGGAVSEAIVLGGNRAYALITPALEALTAKIAFYASVDGVTWSTEHVVYAGAEYTLPVLDPTKTYPLMVELGALYGYTFLKLECLNAAGAGLVQTGVRTFKLLYGPA